MKKIVTDTGYLVYGEAAEGELVNVLDGPGLCTKCSVFTDDGHLLPVTAEFLCEKCFGEVAKAFIESPIKENRGIFVMVKCKGCKKEPAKIAEYQVAANKEKMTPTEFVRKYEGTYNVKTGLFWCSSCYIKAGMPLGIA